MRKYLFHKSIVKRHRDYRYIEFVVHFVPDIRHHQKLASSALSAIGIISSPRLPSLCLLAETSSFSFFLSSSISFHVSSGISGDGTGNITGGISFFSASLFAEASSLFLLSSSHGFNLANFSARLYAVSGHHVLFLSLSLM